MNLALFTGNLGADAELQYTQKGVPVARFSLAVNERRGEEQVTLWVHVSYFGEAAEHVSPYLVKGKQILVRGRIEEHDWQDQDGNERRSWGVLADRVELLGGPAGSNQQQPEGGAQRSHQGGGRPQPGRTNGGSGGQGQRRPQGNRGGYR